MASTVASTGGSSATEPVGSAARAGRSLPGGSVGVDLGPALRALRESVPAALAVAVVIALIGGFVLQGQSRAFESKTVVLVATPARAEATSDQLMAQATTISSVIGDDDVKKEISEQTGVEVTTKGLLPNVRVSVSTNEAAGTVLITTRGDTPEHASDLGNAVAAKMNERATQLRDEALADFQAGQQELIGSIQGQIDARLALDPTASVYDLTTRLDNVRAEANLPRLNHATVSHLSQQTDTPESTSKRPYAVGAVVGIAAGLVTLLMATLLKLRSSARVTEVWLRRMKGRGGVTVDDADRAGGSLPRVTEALVAEAHLRDREVVLLTEHEDSREAETPLTRSYLLGHSWWNDIDADRVGLGVIRVDRKSSSATIVEKNLDVFAALGVPVRLVADKASRP